MRVHDAWPELHAMRVHDVKPELHARAYHAVKFEGARHQRSGSG